MKIEIANGEIVDRVSILAIKLQRIADTQKLHNIKAEYELLLPAMHAIGITEHSDIYRQLMEVNTALWEIEDKLRIKEAKQSFDDDFIQLARSVYFTNDLRAELKKQINLETGSLIVEEKDYVNYK